MPTDANHGSALACGVSPGASRCETAAAVCSGWLDVGENGEVRRRWRRWGDRVRDGDGAGAEGDAEGAVKALLAGAAVVGGDPDEKVADDAAAEEAGDCGEQEDDAGGEEEAAEAMAEVEFGEGAGAAHGGG
jgi:hypothetical protein